MKFINKKSINLIKYIIFIRKKFCILLFSPSLYEISLLLHIKTIDFERERENYAYEK